MDRSAEEVSGSQDETVKLETNSHRKPSQQASTASVTDSFPGLLPRSKGNAAYSHRYWLFPLSRGTGAQNNSMTSRYTLKTHVFLKYFVHYEKIGIYSVPRRVSAGRVKEYLKIGTSRVNRDTWQHYL